MSYKVWMFPTGPDDGTVVRNRQLQSAVTFDGQVHLVGHPEQKATVAADTKVAQKKASQNFSLRLVDMAWLMFGEGQGLAGTR